MQLVATPGQEGDLEQNRHLVVVVVLSCVDDRACLRHARRSVHQIKKGVRAYTPFNQTDWLAPLCLGLRETVPEDQAANKSREIAAFLVTPRGPRKGQPFPSLQRWASLPANHHMNRCLAPETPPHHPGLIIHFLWKRMMSLTISLEKCAKVDLNLHPNPKPRGKTFLQKDKCNV